MQELSRNKMSERTLSRKLASIKSLFNYLVRQEEILVNIAKLIKAPNIPKRLPNYLSTAEISSLLDYPYGDTFKDYRDRLILELFYATGLRISELVKIKIGNIQVEGCTIKVLGKGNKERIVPVGNIALSHIQNYLSNLRVELSAKGKATIQKMLKGESCSFETSKLSKREWNELMESFGFKEKIL